MIYNRYQPDVYYLTKMYGTGYQVSKWSEIANLLIELKLTKASDV